MYPLCGIDKVRARGETWPVDPEMREAFDRLGTDLRGEIRASTAETRAYVDDRIRASTVETRAHIDERVETSTVEIRGYMDERFRVSAVETRAYIDERVETSTAEMRRYFDVVGESLRGDIRAVAELVALSNEGSKRRDYEQAERTDRLEGRVLRLEVRVTRPKDNRKPRRPRRRR